MNYEKKYIANFCLSAWYTAVDYIHSFLDFNDYLIHCNLFRLLIQSGYDVNIKDYDGWTPLHAAAHWGKEEACRILVDNLCDMEMVNKVVGLLNVP